ncbi:hypothetical protein [Mycobacteroides immunogenum]|uniref:hypothetical protein n=1 Tax=Mycobacteroides immunogenum TaxID=83262 RepID=UPI001038E2D2|nr:hypothetical protein [Mycobacteroides immunogenum]
MAVLPCEVQPGYPGESVVRTTIDDAPPHQGARHQVGRWLVQRVETALTTWFLWLVAGRAWAMQRGARWIIQQSARGATTCLLAVAAAAHSDRAFDKLLYCAIGAMIVDGLCLKTGNDREACREEAAFLRWVTKWEAFHGCSFPPYLKHLMADEIYRRVWMRGHVTGMVWIALQLFAFGPMAVKGAASTVPFFLLLLLREIVSRFGPFTVPVTGRWRPTVLL